MGQGIRKRMEGNQGQKEDGDRKANERAQNGAKTDKKQARAAQEGSCGGSALMGGPTSRCKPVRARLTHLGLKAIQDVPHVYCKVEVALLPPRGDGALESYQRVAVVAWHAVEAVAVRDVGCVRAGAGYAGPGVQGWGYVGP